MLFISLLETSSEEKSGVVGRPWKLEWARNQRRFFGGSWVTMSTENLLWAVDVEKSGG